MKPQLHIPYVDSRLSPEELQQYHLGEFERRYEVDGEQFSVYIMDFRRETEHGKAQDYPIDFYAMGFMETDPIKPNELSAAIIEQAKERNSVLIVPRFENLPHNPGSDIEAQLVLKALELESEHGNKEIDFNLATHDVKIIGFSDGARTAVELAGLVNQIPPENENVRRTLRSISPTAVIDIIDEGKKADGTAMFKGFTEQVTWITLEEMRMRLNAQLDDEAQRLNENVHEKMASGEISIPESEFAKAVQHELRSKDESGKPSYPLLKKNLQRIENPKEAFDPKTITQILGALGTILSYKDGREFFTEQLKQSASLNIPFLTDVIDRAVTANPNFRREPGESIKILNSICQFVDLHTPPELMHHLLANETRSPVCDGLHTFDVEAVFPTEDLVFPGNGYGRTIRKQIENLGYPQEIDPEIKDQLETAMQSGNDKLLGDLCIAHPEVFARFLYPQAKSVSLKYVGEKGKTSGSHLAPLKVPENFLN